MIIIKNNKNKKFYIIFSFLIGSFGTIAFSPYDFWPASIISLSGLLALILDCSIREAAYLGFYWGFGLFWTGLYWIYISITQFSTFPEIVNIGLFVILITYLSLYPMLFATLLSFLWPKKNIWTFIFGAPTLWSFTEFLRSKIFTGFPWLQFGYTQIDGPLNYLAPILGVEFITFVLVLISGLLVFSFKTKNILSIFIVLLLLQYPLALKNLKWFSIEKNRSVNVSLIQGNINQLNRWKNNYQQRILDVYLKKTFKYIKKSEIIIWPEAAIPGYEENQNFFLRKLDNILRKHKTCLITGVIDSRKFLNKNSYYNSIIVLGDINPYQYPTTNRYDKHHLVPFGETLILKYFLYPLISSLNIPMSFLEKGNYLQQQITASNMKFTASICYEIILGDQIRDNFHLDTDFLLTISNDAWFGYSIGPWQHFQMARMRSLELGRSLLYCSNNGITAVINSNGTIQKQLKPFTRDILNIKIIPTIGSTPYYKIGPLPMRIFTFLIVLYSTFLNFKYFCILKNSDIYHT